ncbi:MAG: hypothetical protein ACOVSW_20010 [Candidatus Kapaibacteriota bacterium]|jgi:hypothetical protein
MAIYLTKKRCSQAFAALVCGFGLSYLSAQAQTSGGSNYSAFGYGDILESHGAAFDGVGGAAIGATSQYAVNLANPAAWNAVRSTRFQTGFAFRQFLNTDSKGTVAQNGGYLQGFSAIFSIDTVRGISAGFGIVPKSNIQYSYRIDDAAPGDPNLATSTLYRGTGGMTALYLGAAFQILPKLHLGFIAEYTFGNIEMSALTESTSFLAQSRTTITDALSGGAGKIGLQYNGISNLSLGLTAGAGLPINVSRTSLYQFSSGISDATVLDALQAQLPVEIGFGAGYTINRVTILADVVTKDFSTLTYRARRNDVTFRRATRVSAGVSIAGSTDYTSSFLETLGYSIGAGYHQQYYQIGGIGINELYGSLGIQLPVARRVIFDLAITGGVRGTTDNNLTRELFGRFTFSVNVGEIWFQPLFRE